MIIQTSNDRIKKLHFNYIRVVKGINDIDFDRLRTSYHSRRIGGSFPASLSTELNLKQVID